MLRLKCLCTGRTLFSGISAHDCAALGLQNLLWSAGTVRCCQLPEFILAWMRLVSLTQTPKPTDTLESNFAQNQHCFNLFHNVSSEKHVEQCLISLRTLWLGQLVSHGTTAGDTFCLSPLKLRSSLPFGVSPHLSSSSFFLQVLLFAGFSFKFPNGFSFLYSFNTVKVFKF